MKCSKLLSYFNSNVLQCQTRLVKNFNFLFKNTNCSLKLHFNIIIKVVNEVHITSNVFNFHFIESFCNYIITTSSQIIIFIAFNNY